MKTITAESNESIQDAINRVAPTGPVKVRKTMGGKVIEITYVPPQYVREPSDEDKS